MLTRKEKAKQFDRVMAGNATVNDIIKKEKNVFVIQADKTGAVTNQDEYEAWMKENRYTSQYTVIRVIYEDVPINHYKIKTT